MNNVIFLLDVKAFSRDSKSNLADKRGAVTPRHTNVDTGDRDHLEVWMHATCGSNVSVGLLCNQCPTEIPSLC